MRSLRYLPALIFLISVPDAYGQVVTCSVLGHERRIGPLELSACYQQDILSISSHGIVVGERADRNSLDEDTLADTILLGAAGGVIGAMLSFTSSAFEDLPVLPGVMFIAAQPLLQSAGVHLGNRRQGDYVRVMGVSLLSWLATVGGMSFLAEDSDSGGAILIGGLGLQLALTISVERSTAGRKSGIRR